MNKVKRTTWFIFFVVLAVSCLDEPDCFNLNNNLVGISFKVLGSSKADTLTLVDADVSGLLAELAVDSSAVSSIAIPLNLLQEQSTITLYRPNGTKTINLIYRIQSQFVSEDCGSRFVLSNLEVTGHDFDSVRVVNKTPGASRNTSNIEVYRCPVTNLVGIQFRQLYASPRGSQVQPIELVNITDSYSGGSFYNNASVSAVTLSVDSVRAPTDTDSAFTKSTTFIFKLADNTIKELKLNYVVTPEERYRVCGTQSFITKLALDSPALAFDSVSIIKDETTKRSRTTLTDPADNNVYLFRCPITNLARIAFRTPRAAGDTITRVDTVALVRVRADHLTNPINYNSDVSFVDIPLDADKTNSTFYLDYQNGSIDTVALTYTRDYDLVFKVCETQTFFDELKETVEKNHLIIRRDSVQFPPVTNLEIIH
jgi:hypothetical protein